jgi:uridine kinase
LRERSIGAVIAPLDNWLRSGSACEPDVLGRYDMEGMESAIRGLVDRRAAITTPRCDPLTRQSRTDTERIVLGFDDVLILDGIPALLSQELVAMSSLRVFVEHDVDERHRRFSRGGLAEKDVDAVYQARDLDEAPIVRTHAKRADVILTWGQRDHQQDAYAT